MNNIHKGKHNYSLAFSRGAQIVEGFENNIKINPYINSIINFILVYVINKYIINFQNLFQNLILNLYYYDSLQNLKIQYLFDYLFHFHLIIVDY